MAKERSFNFLNLFYGIGAFIILIAAGFKFVGWSHADRIFIVGIVIEAVVFLISAFDWSGGRTGYQWEKVFPQLGDDVDFENAIPANLAEGTQQQQVQRIMETIVSLNSSVNELNSATQKLTSSVEMMEKNYETVTESTRKYQVEIDLLRDKIAAANERLKAFEHFNYNTTPNA